MYKRGDSIRCARTSEHASLSQSSPATFERFSKGMTSSVGIACGLGPEAAIANGSRVSSRNCVMETKWKERKFDKSNRFYFELKNLLLYASPGPLGIFSVRPRQTTPTSAGPESAHRRS